MRINCPLNVQRSKNVQRIVDNWTENAVNNKNLVVHGLSTQPRIMALFWGIAACCCLFNRLNMLVKLTGNQGDSGHFMGLLITGSVVRVRAGEPEKQRLTELNSVSLFSL